MSQGLLPGVRVLELGGEISASYCGRTLALMGAEVIKVAPPEGDAARRAVSGLACCYEPVGVPQLEAGTCHVDLVAGKPYGRLLWKRCQTGLAGHCSRHDGLSTG